MSKLPIIASMMAKALCGCGRHDKLAKCEKIATGKKGDYLIKCTKSKRLEEIAKGKKDSMFLSINMDVIDLTKLPGDKDYIYVNMIPDDTKQFGADADCIRVLVPGADLSKKYAVQTCDRR
jgi:hypothetical protein